MGIFLGNIAECSLPGEQQEITRHHFFFVNLRLSGFLHYGTDQGSYS